MNYQVKTPWPRVAEVKVTGPYRLRVRLEDEGILNLNLSNLIFSRDAFWRLRQQRYFHMVKIDAAGALCWPEGEDIAPESIEKYSE